MVECCVVVADHAPLTDIVDDVVHHVVAAGEVVALVGVDRPASEYSAGFGVSMSLGPDDSSRSVVALVSSRTLARLVAGDADPAIALLRSAIADGIPTLLAVSDLPDTSLEPEAWARVAAWLAGTTARWLTLPSGDVVDARDASRPPADVDLGDELYPPFWAEPWSWAGD